MDTATQSLHRLTSYEPGRVWDQPIDDPLLLQELDVNDLDHFSWFTKRYAATLPECRTYGAASPWPRTGSSSTMITVIPGRKQASRPHSNGL